MNNHRLTSFVFVILCTCLLTVGCKPTGTSSKKASPTTAVTTLGGPYEVGSKTVFLHDKSRGFDTVAGVKDGVRVLITEIWYPVSPKNIKPDSVHPTWGDYVFGDKALHKRMMTETTFWHANLKNHKGEPIAREGVTQEQLDKTMVELFHKERVSYVNVPVAESDAPFPVVVMTHGDAGSRYNMSTACEYLASHGYIVVAPEHTGNSPFSAVGKDPALDSETGNPDIITAMKPVMPLLDSNGVYGHKHFGGQTYIAFQKSDYFALDAAIIQRVNDLRATLDELKKMNTSGEFAGKLDLENVGLMGRSFGGTTTLTALELEDRFKVGVSVVPVSVPDLRVLFPKKALKTSESAFLSAQGESAWTALNKPTMVLNCAEDKTIIGGEAMLGSFVKAPAPTPENTHPSLKAIFEKTTAPVVWTMLENATHASYGISGAYWWPKYKPATGKSFFDPDKSFTKIDVNVAHDIQKEKVLSFFNLFLKGEKTAQKKLLSNEYAAKGLRLEHKNFQ